MLITKTEKVTGIKKEEIKTIWKEQIDELFINNETKSEMLNFLSILTIIINSKFDEKIVNLYEIINNVEMFTMIIDRFSGMTITIPEKDDFKDALIIALSFYYKEIKNLSWKDIQKLIPYEDNLSIRASKGIGKIKKELKEELTRILEEKHE